MQKARVANLVIPCDGDRVAKAAGKLRKKRADTKAAKEDNRESEGEELRE